VDELISSEATGPLATRPALQPRPPELAGEPDELPPWTPGDPEPEAP
jgi:hypothetical protein